MSGGKPTVHLASMALSNWKYCIASMNCVLDAVMRQRSNTKFKKSVFATPETHIPTRRRTISCNFNAVIEVGQKWRILYISSQNDLIRFSELHMLGLRICYIVCRCYIFIESREKVKFSGRIGSNLASGWGCCSTCNTSDCYSIDVTKRLSFFFFWI